MKTLSRSLIATLTLTGASLAAAHVSPGPTPSARCGDGTIALCEVMPAECPEGQVREVVRGCFGACVDALTCEPVPAYCGDGTVAVCEVMPAECPEGQVREVVHGCFGACVDAETCEPV